MALFFQANPPAFFDDRIRQPPSQAVPVSEETHAALMLAQKQGSRIEAGTNGHPIAVDTTPPAVPDSERFVRLSVIRDRVEAAGKWAQFAAALDTLPAATRWHLLTLDQGVAADDADAHALLIAIGLVPSLILAA